MIHRRKKKTWIKKEFQIIAKGCPVNLRNNMNIYFVIDVPLKIQSKNKHLREILHSIYYYPGSLRM